MIASFPKAKPASYINTLCVTHTINLILGM